MSINLFGTDGIRGTVNQHPITPDIVLRFGMAAGVHFQAHESRKKVIIAKDTRLSGYLMEPALVAGLIAVGVDVVLVGPMPTPAVPMLVKSLRADFGIMISASHNPYYDNGLKLFDKNGQKLSDNCEKNIQNLILSEELNSHLASHDKLGRASRLDDAPGRYIEYVKNSFLKSQTLSGIRIVVDCANGSAYKLAPTILWELGAEVIQIGCEPNGFNINDKCGSTYPGALAHKVVETRADLGIALDGDADRIVICDEKGVVVSGDHLIALIALFLNNQNLLRSGIVVTHMSNTALDEFLGQQGIAVYRSKVGDRYVAAEMRKTGCNFGGESSGHIILTDYSTSGDGIIAALQILSLLVSSQKPMSELSQVFQLNPQISKHLHYSSANPLDNHAISDAIEKIREKNPEVHLLVRKSGTEKMLRIMAEGKDLEVVSSIIKKVEKAISAKL